MKVSLAALVVLPVLSACSSTQTPQPTSTPTNRETSRSAGQVGVSSLDPDAITKAEAVARQTIAEQGASVSSATAIERSGSVEHSNTGHPCTSGRELQIKLIGRFPLTVTTGHPAPSGSLPPDAMVRAMVITADAQSGLPCLVSVQTGGNGEPRPLAGSTVLSVG
ncbi:hypothetical protein [Motilibacter peucedani]|uniref:hypothetical protein n=1 Tax=Motilibacter peucedani TaxID=598650 RepID=UPI0016008DDF|nr:hypothetical protein [Motilibacter peucedani]